MENANDYRLIDALISSQNAVSALNIQLTKLEKEKIDLTRLISLVIANTRLNYDGSELIITKDDDILTYIRLLYPTAYEIRFNELTAAREAEVKEAKEKKEEEPSA